MMPSADAASAGENSASSQGGPRAPRETATSAGECREHATLAPTPTAATPAQKDQPHNVRAAIFALGLGAFAIGTTEFATMGLLPQIAQGLGVSITQAGHAVSAYAIGVVIGAPLITAVAAHMPRKPLLLSLMAIFVAGNVLSIFASNLPVMLAARFVAGLPHGAYLGIAAVVAATLVPPQRKGTAMARVMLGLTGSNIVGVPIAAALGAQLGWQSAYLLVTILGAATILAVAWLTPHVSVGATPSMRGELRSLKHPQIILTLVAGAVGFGGMFALYTYIAPLMTEVTGIPGSALPWVLVLYGVGMTAGSLIAGPSVDRSVEKSALAGVAGSSIILLLVGATAANPYLVLPALFCVGIAGSLYTTALQVRLLRDSREAPSLSAAMNHAAFNMANALGAFLGGVVIDAGLGLRAPAFTGAGLALLGFIVLIIAVARYRSGRSHNRRSRNGRTREILDT